MKDNRIPFSDEDSLKRREMAYAKAELVKLRIVKYWYEHGGFCYEDLQAKVGEEWVTIPVINLVKMVKGKS